MLIFKDPLFFWYLFRQITSRLIVCFDRFTVYYVLMQKKTYRLLYFIDELRSTNGFFFLMSLINIFKRIYWHKSWCFFKVIFKFDIAFENSRIVHTNTADSHCTIQNRIMCIWRGIWNGMHRVWSQSFSHKQFFLIKSKNRWMR